MYSVKFENYDFSEVIEWRNNIEDILLAAEKLFNKFLEGSEYYCKRNTTINEKDIDLFKKGIDKRIGHIWPKKQTHTVDFCLENDYIVPLRLKMELPHDKDVKPGRYLNQRCFDKISIEMACKILDNISKV